MATTSYLYHTLGLTSYHHERWSGFSEQGTGIYKWVTALS